MVPGTPKDGWDGSMRRFCAPADETPNAFGGWFEHVRAFEAVVAALLTIWEGEGGA